MTSKNIFISAIASVLVLTFFSGCIDDREVEDDSGVDPIFIRETSLIYPTTGSSEERMLLVLEEDNETFNLQGGCIGPRGTSVTFGNFSVPENLSGALVLNCSILFKYGTDRPFQEEETRRIGYPYDEVRWKLGNIDHSSGYRPGVQDNLSWIMIPILEDGIYLLDDLEQVSVTFGVNYSALGAIGLYFDVVCLNVDFQRGLEGLPGST